MTPVILVVVMFLLVGCASSSPPRVTDFNGNSVKVSVYCGIAMECSKPREEDLAQANSTCALQNKKAQFASTSFRTEASANFSTQVADHLYLCV